MKIRIKTATPALAAGIALAVLLAGPGISSAAEPPEYLNYQGVLRDSSDDARDGTHDMVFHFYDVPGDAFCEGGTLLLTDAHEAAGTGAVQVTNGLFNVHVGEGALTPGTESSLSEVFRDNETVYLQVTVATEKLCPRIRVVAAGYSLNADNLDGRDGAEYVNTSSDPQAKAGDLAVADLTVNGDDLAFGGGASMVDEGFRLKIIGGDTDTDNLLLMAGDGSDDGYIQLYGGGGILLRSGDGQFDFVNGAVGGTRAQLNGVGDMWISGDFDVHGNDLSFGYGSTVASGVTSLQLQAGDLDGDDLFLSAGNSTDDGAIEIYGDQLMRLRSGDGHFEFFSGNTSLIADLSPTGDLQIDGNLDAGGVLSGDGSGLTDVPADTLDGLDSSQFLRSDASDSFTSGTLSFSAGAQLSIDSASAAAPGMRDTGSFNTGIYFPAAGQLAVTTAGTRALNLYGNGDALLAGRLSLGDNTADNLQWNTANSRFEFSDDLYAAGYMYASAYYDSGDTSCYANPGGTSIFNSLRLNSTSALYLNNDGPDANAVIYFYNAGSNTAEAFFWDDAGDEFELSDDLYISGAIYGVEAFGSSAGGYFHDSDSGGYGYVGYSTYGGNFIGSTLGARGYDDDQATYAYLSYGTSSTYGNGAKNFVQNHPEHEDQVIVYAAPEGNEVATYTRGTARLENGEARVTLDETFAWVTNPDIGLTAHLTPRGQEASLFVASLSTRELVVRSSADSAGDAVFDYMVWGLRIGFEETGVVREKGEEEAWIPSMAQHREMREKHPEWDRYLALERFRSMRLETGETGPLDLSASIALRDAIQEYDPDVHGRGDPISGASSEIEAKEGGPPVVDAELDAGPGTEGGSGGVAVAAVSGDSAAVILPMDGEGNVYARSFRPSASDMASLARVAEEVEAGDVLVIDPRQSGIMTLARQAADTAVFGIVAADPGVVLGSQPPTTAGFPVETGEAGEESGAPVEGTTDPVTVEVPVALSGVALCKVDAGYGSIRPGDLLTTSPTIGHAMRADEPRPGTILCKALEPLDAGTGLVRVLVMLR